MWWCSWTLQLQLLTIATEKLSRPGRKKLTKRNAVSSANSKEYSASTQRRVQLVFWSPEFVSMSLVLKTRLIIPLKFSKNNFWLTKLISVKKFTPSRKICLLRTKIFKVNLKKSRNFWRRPNLDAKRENLKMPLALEAINLEVEKSRSKLFGTESLQTKQLKDCQKSRRNKSTRKKD